MPLSISIFPISMACCRRIAGIGVDQQRDAVIHGLAHGGDDLLGAAWPFILAATAFGADAELEGVEAELVTQAAQPRSLVLRGDVAFHGGAIGADGAGCAADQLADRLALDPATQVPERRVEAAERALEVGAGELVLLLGDQIHQVIDVDRRLAKRVGRHLPVHDLCRDVGVIGRDLAPADVAGVGRDLDEADELVGEGFNVTDFHVVSFHAAIFSKP
jgi:hypothetical protein